MKKLLIAALFVILLASCGTPEIYTITFNQHTDESVFTVTVEEGNSVLEPTTPINEGYTFAGWYTDSTLLVPYDFSRTVSSNIELHAKWELSEFNIIVYTKNGAVVSTTPYTYGDSTTDFTLPTDVEIPGYIFEGWDIEIPNTMPANDVEIHPIYSLRMYKFVYLDPIVLDPISTLVEVGTDLELPPLNNFEGLSFEGWYLDLQYLNLFNLTVMPDEDVYVYAKWEVIEYTIDFYDYENNLISSIDVEYGSDLSEVTPPTPPVIEGMTFTGWDTELTGLMPANDLSLYAQYSTDE